MLNETLREMVRAVRVATRFATLIERRGRFSNEGAAATVANETMRHAYAEAASTVPERARKEAPAPAISRFEVA